MPPRFNTPGLKTDRNGDKGDTFGVGYVFTPWKSVEFYGTYYLHMLTWMRAMIPTTSTSL